ncbi:prepilin-type N-terminal cleavage/methylation domain-containing protein [Cellvibrio sp. KY-GH-1]|uniref:type IV pilin protein n=1 Tax=Cellvibrio sp. KY-GH-1 TaxID=2303332 RepID=UPI0012493BE7|nr:type IV pilin protein [Cellvibrio sp. KY-GH-1]QEY17969.1 prepilin-type N-terminal cleavage/methylation domain-containing protein [Cellvibrio sp. KY-GH-1]
MKKAMGFTLIEAMITVTIIGIIAAMAYPSYLDSIRRSNRAEAKTELMDLAQRLQRCYTGLARFDDEDNCAVYKDLADGGVVTRGSGFYEITIGALETEPTRTAYLLKAKAIKSPQTEGDCKELTLSSKGVQLPDGCW